MLKIPKVLRNQFCMKFENLITTTSISYKDIKCVAEFLNQKLPTSSEEMYMLLSSLFTPSPVQMITTNNSNLEYAFVFERELRNRDKFCIIGFDKSAQIWGICEADTETIVLHNSDQYIHIPIYTVSDIVNSVVNQFGEFIKWN